MMTTVGVFRVPGPSLGLTLTLNVVNAQTYCEGVLSISGVPYKVRHPEV